MLSDDPLGLADGLAELDLTTPDSESWTDLPERRPAEPVHVH